MKETFIYNVPKKVLQKLKNDHSGHMLDYQIDMFKVRVECIAGKEFWNKIQFIEVGQ